MIDRLNAALEGRYRIERELGEGGMASVYLAHDVRHDRQVAVKVLRPELAAVVGGERFLAEIRTTANLQHPHILPLFDSGEADSFLFFVMPRVEGETLRARLEREHQLPVKDAVSIAEKVAAALQYAHEQGVVHRDIKPANILLSRGEPLVADFGIALALSEAGGGRVTETGLSLGTPHYMSPEQAAGERTLDRRSDVYALGCVLYEMLTGQPPFGGSTAQAVLGRILTGSPAKPTEHRKTIPVNVEHAAMKALEKLPADRFDSAAAFIAALESPSFRHGAEGSVSPLGTASRGRLAGAGAAVAVVAFLAGGWAWSALASPEAPPTTRQRISLGTWSQMPPPLVNLAVALAPNSSGIVFRDSAGGIRQLWWKAAGETDAVPIVNTVDAARPTFSPDGAWLAFFMEGNELRKQTLLGGQSVLLAGSAGGGNTPALAWLEGGTILFEDPAFNLVRVRDDGGERQILATRAEIDSPVHLSAIPGGWGALVITCPEDTCSPGITTLRLVDLERDTIAPLGGDIMGAWPMDAEHVVYVDVRGAVFVAALDRDALALGTPVPLFDGVAMASGSAGIVVGADGTLLYQRGEVADELNLQVLWVDRNGDATPVDPSWRGRFASLALSPDGASLAVTEVTDEGSGIWVKELPDGPRARLTADGPSVRRPVWTPDGREVAFQRRRADTLLVFDIRRFDASTQARRFLEQVGEGEDWPRGEDLGVHSLSISRDGRYVVYRAGARPNGHLRLAEIDGSDTTHRDLLLDEGSDEVMPVLSSDGRWLAYQSDVSGHDEIYVRPFPNVERSRLRVSIDGGVEPLWSRDGRELFYVDGQGRQMAAAVEAEPAFRVTGRTVLFQRGGRFQINSSEHRADVAPDGRFVMVGVPPAGGAASGPLVLVQNWFTEVRERLRRR